MTAIAADAVWTHNDVLLNPHYAGMGLHGAELWSHTLPHRVGAESAFALTAGMQPMGAAEGKEKGLVDAILSESRHHFNDALQQVIACNDGKYC